MWTCFCSFFNRKRVHSLRLNLFLCSIHMWESCRLVGTALCILGKNGVSSKTCFSARARERLFCAFHGKTRTPVYEETNFYSLFYKYMRRLIDNLDLSSLHSKLLSAPVTIFIWQWNKKVLSKTLFGLSTKYNKTSFIWNFGLSTTVKCLFYIRCYIILYCTVIVIFNKYRTAIMLQ